MKRLTEWLDGHGACLKGDGYTKLAKYEDTGLEPEEVQSLVDEYARYFPCKIGDTMYSPRRIFGKAIASERTVIGIDIREGATYIKVVNPRNEYVSMVNAGNIGRVLFKTKQECIEFVENGGAVNEYDN